MIQFISGCKRFVWLSVSSKELNEECFQEFLFSVWKWSQSEINFLLKFLFIVCKLKLEENFQFYKRYAGNSSQFTQPTVPNLCLM